MFFGQQQQPSVSLEMMQAELNMDLFVEFQTKAIETCRVRCINKEYRMDQMGRAEAVCADRCISKFFETSQILQQEALKEMAKKQSIMDQQLGGLK